MTDTSEDVISTLNDLIEISKDGERGFTTSAEDVTEASLKTMLLDGARRCAEGAAELQREVRRL